MHLLKRLSFLGGILIVASVLFPLFGATASSAFAATSITQKTAAPAAALTLCNTPVPIYAFGSDGSLLWFGYTDPQDGTSSWVRGVGTEVGTGVGGSTTFSGGQGILYTIHSDGTLWWYKHLGYRDGSPNWANGGVGIQIGHGWSGTTFSAGGGIIFTIHADGTLYWYNHLGYLDGSAIWANGSGNLIGSNWDTLSGPFADVLTC